MHSRVTTAHLSHVTSCISVPTVRYIRVCLGSGRERTCVYIRGLTFDLCSDHHKTHIHTQCSSLMITCFRGPSSLSLNPTDKSLSEIQHKNTSEKSNFFIKNTFKVLENEIQIVALYGLKLEFCCVAGGIVWHHLSQGGRVLFQPPLLLSSSLNFQARGMFSLTNICVSNTKTYITISFFGGALWLFPSLCITTSWHRW